MWRKACETQRQHEAQCVHSAEQQLFRQILSH